MKITLIIPMYNESSIINGAIDTFYGYMKEHFDDWELIFVDDGSVDGCGKAVEAKSAEDNRVRLISYTPNMGKGCAVRTGMLASTGDIVIFTDCDNAYGTDVIGRMVKRFEESDSDGYSAREMFPPTDMRAIHSSASSLRKLISRYFPLPRDSNIPIRSAASRVIAEKRQEEFSATAR